MSEFDQDTLQSRIEAIKAKYEPRIRQLVADGEALKSDVDDNRPSEPGAVIGIDFKVDWKEEELIFDIPSVTLSRKSVGLDLPEIRAGRQHIAFDVPDVRMVDRIVGYKPEWHGPFHVEMTPIIISVPEPYMRRVDIYYDLPEVAMKRQDFVIYIPEFRMERVRWVLNLPQFTVINVSAQTDAWKSRGEELQARGQALAAEMKAEIDREVQAFTQKLAGAASEGRQAVTGAFDGALVKIKGAIDDLVSKGCDPVKVPTDGGNVNLRQMYLDVSDQKAQTLERMDAEASDLNKSQPTARASLSLAA